MSLPQMHYTSAPPGPDGSGFRFTAVTPGVPASVLREAEQLIGYEPPRDAPSRPTPDDLALFPEMFSHTRLSDGSGLLSRTVYTGADYSGRWGNFHAHAVHLAAGERLSGDMPPIAAWGAPEWADRTPEDGAPPLGRLTPPPSHELRSELAAFAAGRTPWLAAVLADLRRLAESPHAPQVVLAEEDTGRVAHWVMLACTALPRDFARDLTFTTYTRRPQQARQQLVGVRPEDVRSVAGQPHRYSVHDCSDPSAAPAAPADPWARTAAAVLASGLLPLFRRAREAAGEDSGAAPFAPGPLAALALVKGVAVPEDARTEAAAWVRAHPTALDEPTLARFLEAVCEVVPGTSELPSDALAGLLDALHGTVPAALTAPLTARLVDRALRGGATALPPLPPGALPEPYRSRLAAESGEELRRALRDPLTSLARVAELLRVARLLGVGHDDLAAPLAERIGDGLLSGAGAGTGSGAGTGTGSGSGSGAGFETGYGSGAGSRASAAEALRDAFAEPGRLLDLALGHLDARAADDPPGTARALRDARLPLDGVRGVPHLLMCAAATGTGPDAPGARGESGARTGDGSGGRDGDGSGGPWRDRNGELHRLLRVVGASPHGDPLALRTAVALVWEDRGPTAAEASLLLSEAGARPHVAAGTWDHLVTAAVDAPPEDEEAPLLARQILAAAPESVGRSVLDDLKLLSLVHDLEQKEDGAAQGGWTARVRALSDSSRPGVRKRATAALARRLLSPDRPADELGELARSDDLDVIDAYASAARTPFFRDVLRSVPRRTANCFVDWNAHAGASPAWDLTRRALLDEVLRPVVRGLSDENVLKVEEQLSLVAIGRVYDFREWNRPAGALGRLFRRRGRAPETPSSSWRGDVERPEGKRDPR
ncbi:GTPase-associated protein 1-related protein [Streptomyces cinereoruber]|uniref:GTPase-associated protein 1-related protein n=1 Tax=Streptomyces cinereoruber TaxID=67260 RepID=UPI00362F941F